ncbi:hypothetical protein ACK3TF_000781 [Chlorella vulgaris]
MCLTCLPCIGASAWAGVKVSKSVDRAFSSKKPEEPIEPSFVTEAKLRWNLVSKPSAAAPSESQRPKRSDRYSSKELASKQRLAELVESHKAGSRAPAAQSTRR